MIGYQVLPVEGIPPDINTITFVINPAYTMSGSLDGMTGMSTRRGLPGTAMAFQISARPCRAARR